MLPRTGTCCTFGAWLDPLLLERCGPARVWMTRWVLCVAGLGGMIASSLYALSLINSSQLLNLQSLTSLISHARARTHTHAQTLSGAPSHLAVPTTSLAHALLHESIDTHTYTLDLFVKSTWYKGSTYRPHGTWKSCPYLANPQMQHTHCSMPEMLNKTVKS